MPPKHDKGKARASSARQADQEESDLAFAAELQRQFDEEDRLASAQTASRPLQVSLIALVTSATICQTELLSDDIPFQPRFYLSQNFISRVIQVYNLSLVVSSLFMTCYSVLPCDVRIPPPGADGSCRKRQRQRKRQWKRSATSSYGTALRIQLSGPARSTAAAAPDAGSAGVCSQFHLPVVGLG